MSATARVLRFPTPDVSNEPAEQDVAEAILDQQLTNLEQMAGSARWPETLAVQVGQALAHAQGDIEDRHRRARSAMMQEARQHTVRLARWTGAMIREYGGAWYEVAIQRGMTTLDKQTLYNARQVLRVDPELRDAYDVWPSELIAASSVPTKEGQAALLAHAELEGVGARQVATLAKAMREQGLDDVPVLPATGRGDDLPDALAVTLGSLRGAVDGLAELCEELIGELTDARLSLGDDADVVMRGSLRYKARLGAIRAAVENRP